MKRSQCVDSRFAAQLEHETRGQVRMWRLPASDSQHQRCVKAARENVKRDYFSPCASADASLPRSAPPSLEVLSVYKIENRPLLQQFHCFTQSLTLSDVKIKGLFCTVPTASVEHCVVWGMHRDEPSFRAALRAPQDDVQVFSRATYGHSELLSDPGAYTKSVRTHDECLLLYLFAAYAVQTTHQVLRTLVTSASACARPPRCSSRADSAATARLKRADACSASASGLRQQTQHARART